MAEQIQWLDGKAKVQGIVEKICPERHIRQNQWQSEWYDMYLNDRSEHRYDYISDYECIFLHPVERSPYFNRRGLWDELQAAKQQGTHISIVNLAHFTELPSAEGIIKSGGFKGRKKKINEDATRRDVKAKFSWWSPIFGEDDIKLVRETLGAAIQPFLTDDEEISDQEDEAYSNQEIEEGGDQDNEEGTVQIDAESNEQDDDQDDLLLTRLQKQFATSEAFNPNAQRNGFYYFQYNINNLCDYYRVHFHCELQFKILGTFSYKKEVMHAVLVCSQENGDGPFNEYPSVLTPEEDDNNDAVVTRDNNGNWVWKPQATGSGEIKRLPDENMNYPKYRRWEHVAFAFHIPKEWKNNSENEPFITVPDLRGHLHNLLS